MALEKIQYADSAAYRHFFAIYDRILAKRSTNFVINRPYSFDSPLSLYIYIYICCMCSFGHPATKQHMDHIIVIITNSGQCHSCRHRRHRAACCHSSSWITHRPPTDHPQPHPTSNTIPLPIHDVRRNN